MIYTIGHSTRTLAEFLQILKKYSIKQVVDIRTIPRSFHNSQFNREPFSVFLRNHHINYAHYKGLGGLRHAKKDSINDAWRNASFRGYADYMQTPEFARSLHRLIKASQKRQVVIMCSEAVPWRCHRSLVADALVAHQMSVYDIYSLRNIKIHKLTPWATVNGTHVTYQLAK